MLKSIERTVLSDSRSDLFPDLNTHIFDDTTEELSEHVFLLSKLIIKKYLEIKMNALAKICTIHQTGRHVRHYKNREMVWLHI